MRSQAQYTIYSLNDVTTSSTAPQNPYKGQLWVDTSKNPPITYVWSGTSWGEQNGTEALRSSITTLTTKQADFKTNLDGLSSTVSSVTKRIETVESDVGVVESNVLSLQQNVSSLIQTTNEISADVSMKADAEYGTSASSFGWSLKSNGFYLYSNSSTVMSVTSSGLAVTGSIEAKSGTLENMTITGKLYFGGDSTYYINANYNDTSYYIYLPGLRIDKASKAVFSGKLSAPSGNIGGFTIATSSIYATKTSYNSTTAGVYVGTDGIGLGAGTFYVTSAGKLYATDAEISGTITATSGTIGGFTINASSLTNTSGGSYISITSGSYTTYLGANTCYSRYTESAGSRGWSLSHSAISISSYTSSVYCGLKIMPYYTKRSSISSYSSTTVAEGCITAFSVPSYNVDGNYTTGSAVPFILGLSRQYAKSPYTPSHEWGAYLRFVNYQLAELVYDSYYSGVWRLRDAYTGKTYDLGGHKFYFWSYTSSISDDNVVTCTQTTHGLTTVKGAVVFPRSTATAASGLSGYTNITNKGYQSVGVTISGTTVYVAFDYGTYQKGFYCLIYGS